MNRRSRRHPSHPLLPILYPSKKGVASVNEKAKGSSKSGGNNLKGKNKKVNSN